MFTHLAGMSDIEVLYSKEKYNRDSHASLLLNKDYVRNNNHYLSLAFSLLNKDSTGVSCLNYIKELGIPLSYIKSFSEHDYSVLKGKKRVDLKTLKKAANIYENAKLLGAKNGYDFGGLETLFYLTEFIKEKGGLIKNDNDYTMDTFLRRLNVINDLKKEEYIPLTPLPAEPASLRASLLAHVNNTDILPGLTELPVNPVNATKVYDFVKSYVSNRIPTEGCSPELRTELTAEALDDYRCLTLEMIKDELIKVKEGKTQLPVISREQAFSEIKGLFNKLRH